MAKSQNAGFVCCTQKTDSYRMKIKSAGICPCSFFILRKEKIEMATIIHYGKGEVCPICGSPDWCGYIGYTKTLYLYCHRYLKPDKKKNTVLTGNEATLEDGRKFVFVGVTADGFGKFRDYGSWKRNKDWEDKHTGLQKKSSDWKVRTSDSTKANLMHPTAEQMRPSAGMTSSRTRDIPANQKPIRDVAYLDRVYRELLSQLVLEEGDRMELIQHDGWSDELMRSIFSAYPFRSLPPSDWDRYNKDGIRYQQFRYLQNKTRKKLILDLQEKFGENGLYGVPGFYTKKDGTWTMAGMDGYFIPQYNAEGKIYRLRIRTSQAARDEAARQRFERMDDPEREQIAESIDVPVSDKAAIIAKISRGFGKYVAMSSNGYLNGCAGTSQISFYGLNYLKTRYPKMKIKRVFVCEGEKKGIVASTKLGYLVITLPGVGTYRLLADPMAMSSEGKDLLGESCSCLEWLKKLGIERITVANDTDMMENAMVRDATMGTLRLINENGFVPEFAHWNHAFGKGLDDCLIHGGKVSISRVENL